MVGFLFIQVFIHLRVATHSGWLKTPDLGQKEACNQGKEDFKQLTYSRMHLHPRLLERMFSSGSTTEPERFGKVRPLGLRGRTPLQGIPYVYPCLISSASLFGHVGRSFLLLVPHSSSSSKEQELKII